MLTDGAKDADPKLCMSVESKKTGNGLHLEALSPASKQAWLAGLQFVRRLALSTHAYELIALSPVCVALCRSSASGQLLSPKLRSARARNR